MPELPEVETIRRGLSAGLLGKKINRLEILWPRTVKTNLQKFAKILTGNKILNIERLGKLLIFELKNRQYVLVHLKMTGQLIYRAHDKCVAGGHKFLAQDLKTPNRHTRLIIYFADKSILYFNDLRKFGYFKLVDELTKEKTLKQFSLEPIQPEFNLNHFKKIFSNRKTTVKALLLNQKLIAGLGNIYADEACFRAKIRPNKKAGDLTDRQLKNLWLACKNILRQALKYKGTTFNNFVDEKGVKGNYSRFLRAYGRQGQKCQRCRQAIIKKIKTANRGTHYCPVCQK